MIKNWDDVVKQANEELSIRGLDNRYTERLKFELKEIDKQGANIYWIGLIKESKRFKTNPNKLLLPWLFNLVDDDPIATRVEPLICTTRASEIKKFLNEHGSLPSDITKDQDMPDIDLDCLPDARDPIKQYAIETYSKDFDDGYGAVCSVGTWQTYKFKSALADVARATETVEQSEILALTKKLPEDVDNLKDGGYATCKNKIIDNETKIERECGTSHNADKCPSCGSSDTDAPTIGKLIAEYNGLNDTADLAGFEKKYPQVVDYAVRLVGRIRNMGMHAGAIIIADRTLYGNVPMVKNSNDGYWISAWTEGRNTQLSKFGYNKWDILGLKTLEYTFKCSQLIYKNRGISFGENAEGLDYNDPLQNIAGYYFDGDGNKHYIDLNDPYALSLANRRMTDAIFQFDTEVAKNNLVHGVKHFNDLMLLNAMGHPGPMASIPEAMQNRDDKRGTWKNRLHPDILESLEDTYGVIVYQEQLQAIWQKLAGFTAPEAQDARKAVAKKWAHKLKPIKEKWLDGASKTLGMQEAISWWNKMETFGRYAFNRCLGKDTILIDSITCEEHTVSEWHAIGRPFHMRSFNGETVVDDECVAIHENGEMEVFEITFDNGKTETVTMNHKFLCDDGEYHEVREIIDKGLEVVEVRDNSIIST